MDRALEADPGNLEVLLSLGVSHTNELDASEALSYLHRWITAHPVHGPAVGAAPGPPDSSQRHAYVVSALRCLVQHLLFPDQTRTTYRHCTSSSGMHTS